MIWLTILKGCEALILGIEYFVIEKPWTRVNLCLCRKLTLPNRCNAPRRLKSQPYNMKSDEQMLHRTRPQVSRWMISEKTRLRNTLLWECSMLLDVWPSFEMMLLRVKVLHARYKFKSQAMLMVALTHASYWEHNNEALKCPRSQGFIMQILLLIIQSWYCPLSRWGRQGFVLNGNGD